MPAAGRRSLTWLYDSVVGLSMREGVWRARVTKLLVNGLGAGGVVLDVGCGTGRQAVEVARARPDLTVIGVDGDPEVLKIARRRVADAVDLRPGRVGALPVEDRGADRVLLSLVLHHLQPDEKVAALTEAARVLRPGGALHVVDWGPPLGLVPRVGFGVLQIVDGRSNTRDHGSGRWLEAFAAARVGEPELVWRAWTVWGTLEHWVSA